MWRTTTGFNSNVWSGMMFEGLELSVIDTGEAAIPSLPHSG
jgi:hypothetical protein